MSIPQDKSDLTLIQFQGHSSHLSEIGNVNVLAMNGKLCMGN